MSITGTVLRTLKTSIHDGNGLRTVVFLKGCPLRCKWCSTPESQNGAVEFGYGTVMTTDEVMREVSKDEIFYFHSGGGVTVSGGEPLAQADFTAEILKQSQKLAINTALETSMFGNRSELAKILPYLNTLYADIKHIDSTAHKELIGTGNELILENIKAADDCLNGSLVVRIPLIPSCNMTAENAEGIGRFCENLSKLREIELLPYHRLGMETYRSLNRELDFFDTGVPGRDEIEDFAGVIRKVAPAVFVKY